MMTCINPGIIYFRFHLGKFDARLVDNLIGEASILP